MGSATTALRRDRSGASVGHGHFDIAAYDNFFDGKLEDVALDGG
jgi:hypothetical protein